MVGWGCFAFLITLLYCLQGLLQSEVEGVDDENVGFYGRCMLHALHPTCESGSDPTDAEISFTRKAESTCARTEVFCPTSDCGVGSLAYVRTGTHSYSDLIIPLVGFQRPQTRWLLAQHVWSVKEKKWMLCSPRAVKCLDSH